jgi:hypothetical protein
VDFIAAVGWAGSGEVGLCEVETVESVSKVDGAACVDGGGRTALQLEEEIVVVSWYLPRTVST